MTQSSETILPIGELELGGRKLVVEKVIGSGLTSEVYRGRLFEDEATAIPVAIKAMKALSFDFAQQAFRTEMLTLPQMRRHEELANEQQNVSFRVTPDYHGSDVYNGTDYFVMELIEGREVPDLLMEAGRHGDGSLPELQALTAGWHLYRTLDILHTRMRKTFIDLKFENLWWVGSFEDGQLKMSDFGTLEDVDLNQRGVRRDVLLAGVYLCKMLTGQMPDYSLGRLRERAEPIIRQSTVSWGARQILLKLLHRNAEARLTSADVAATELRSLVAMWRMPKDRLLPTATRLLNRAPDDEDEQSSRKSVEQARALLDIARLRLGDSLELDRQIQRADEILSRNEYLETGQALFYGMAYEKAREQFEKGMHWSNEPAVLRRWSNLARIGQEIAAADFDDEARKEAIYAVGLMGSEQFDAALYRLERLLPGIHSKGLEALRSECRLQLSLLTAIRTKRTDDYGVTADAFRQALAEFEKLPSDQQKFIREEELGDLRLEVERYMRLDAATGESRRNLIAAKEALDEGRADVAVELARQALSLDYDNPAVAAALTELLTGALSRHDIETAGRFAAIALRGPRQPETLHDAVRLVSYLQSAHRAALGRDQATFVAEYQAGMALAKTGAGEHRPPMEPFRQLLLTAHTRAEKAGDVPFLRALAPLARSLDPDLSRRLGESAAAAESKRQAELQKRVDSLATEAYSLLALRQLDDPKRTLAFVAGWSQTQLLTYLKNDQHLLADAYALAEEAARIGATIDYRRSEMETLHGELSGQVRAAEEERKATEEAVATEQEQIGRELKTQMEQLERLHKARNSATGAERFELDQQLEAGLQSLIILSGRYLSDVDPESREVQNLREFAFRRLDSTGLSGWDGLREMASNRHAELEREFGEVRQRFEDGENEGAGRKLEALAPSFRDSPEWRELDEKLRVAGLWRKWQHARAPLLEREGYSADLLSELRRAWLPFGGRLPTAYWSGSTIERYLQRSEKATIERMHSSIRQPHLTTFLDQIKTLFDLEMTFRQTPARPDVPAPKKLNASAFLNDVYRTAKEQGAKGVEAAIREMPTTPDVETALQEMTPEAWTIAVSRFKGTKPVRRPAWHYVLAASFAAMLLCLIVAGLYYLFFRPPDESALTQTAVAAAMDTAEMQLSSGGITSHEYEGTRVAAFNQLALLNGDPTLPPPTPPPPTDAPPVMPPPMPTIPSPVPSAISPVAPVLPTNTLVPPTTEPTAVSPSDPAASIYYKGDPTVFNPPAPIIGEAHWILPLDNALVSPRIAEGGRWQTEEEEGLGIFHYLTSVTETVSITWQMDQYFNDGVYLVYALDTRSWSAGAYSFDVTVDGESVTPFRGINQVIFNHPQQSSHSWVMLGAYEVQTGETLGLKTRVGPREQPLALPQILIARAAEHEQAMLTALPEAEISGRPLFSLLDDSRGEFNVLIQDGDNSRWGTPFDVNRPLEVDSSDVWRNAYHTRPFVEGTNLGFRFTWFPVGRLPAGEYELRFWVPANNSPAWIEFELSSDGTTVERSNPAEFPLARQEAGWQTIGTWMIPQEAAVGVRMITTRDLNRRHNPDFGEVEFLFDAVALLRVR